MAPEVLVLKIDSNHYYLYQYDAQVITSIKLKKYSAHHLRSTQYTDKYTDNSPIN